MANGHFKYQRLLDIRQLLLRIKSLSLIQAQDAERAEQEKFAHIATEKNEHISRGGVDTGTSIALHTHDFQMQTWYTQQLNEEAFRQELQIKMAKKTVEKRRLDVEKIAIEKRSFEKLQEYQSERDRLEMNHTELRQNDERASRRFIHNSGNDNQ